jgi:hypothetical protein
MTTAGCLRLTMMTAALVLVLAGCAAVTCDPVTILVRDKDERARVETSTSGLYRETPTGKLEPVAAPSVVREYRVQGEDGQWHRVTKEQFTAARVGLPLELCR